MRGILSSARMRRRLAWTAAFLSLAGLVAGLIVAFPSPKQPKEAKLTNVPGDVVKQDKPRPFGPRMRDVLTVARKFILTAVARHHTADSWDLVAPSLRQGFTKERWGKGDIPVVPYPVLFGKWRLGYSFENEVDVRVALFAKRSKKLRPVVFDLTLQRFKGRDGSARWLVSSFLPAGSSGDDTGSGRLNPFAIGTQEPGPASHTSSTWLFLPLGIFGSLLLVLVVLGIRGWRGARIYRAHVRERQISSSRPS